MCGSIKLKKLINCKQKGLRSFLAGTFLLFVFAVFTLVSCSKKVTAVEKATVSSPLAKNMLTINNTLVFDHDFVFTDEVTIMPQAFISTVNGKKISFTKHVNIIGESAVFDTNAEIKFEPGTISQLNPAWFGAKGYDNLDDTKAFQKVLELAWKTDNTITIRVDVGRYFIAEPLVVQGDSVSMRAINWVGGGMSNGSVQGASLSWTGKAGGTMMRFKNLSRFRIENMDFTAEPNSTVKYNLEFAPVVHFVDIQNCSFSGCGGSESANISMNIDNGEQVSEIRITQCEFSGKASPIANVSQSAIRGGLANTKNFYVTNCSFDAYQKAAIDIRISDILRVVGCTFSNDALDISCGLCGSYVESNYSEHSKAFFSAGVSANLAFTTLINNNFTGNPDNGLVIPDGSGSLYLINNNFGGTDQREDLNRIRWEENEFSPIYSHGNFYKNTNNLHSPFLNRSGQSRNNNTISKGDLGGKNATSGISLKSLE